MARKVNVGEGARRRLAQHEQEVAAEVAAAAVPEGEEVRQDTGVLVQLPVEAIAPDPGNPRKDLAGLDGLVSSIKLYGVLQPITVRPADPGEDVPEGVRYVLVMGERRHTAAARAGLEKIPAVVRSTMVADRLPVMLLENLQRQALSPVEEAVAYQALIEQGLSQREISRRLGVSQPHVHRRLALLSMDPAALDLVVSGRLSVDVAANEVAKLEPRLQQLWAQEVINAAAAEAAMVQKAEVGAVSPAEARSAISKVLRQAQIEAKLEWQRAWASERGIEAVDRDVARAEPHERWQQVDDPDNEVPDGGRRIAIIDRWSDGDPTVYDLVPRTQDEQASYDDQAERTEQRENREKERQRREKDLRRAVDQLVAAGDVPPKPQLLPLMARWILRRAHAIDMKRVRKALGDKVSISDEWGWEAKVSVQDSYRLVTGLLIVSDAEQAHRDPEARERISALLDGIEPGLAERLLGEAGAE